jgi:hypothetical protein
MAWSCGKLRKLVSRLENGRCRDEDDWGVCRHKKNHGQDRCLQDRLLYVKPGRRENRNLDCYDSYDAVFDPQRWRGLQATLIMQLLIGQMSPLESLCLSRKALSFSGTSRISNEVAFNSAMQRGELHETTSFSICYSAKYPACQTLYSPIW